MRQYPVLALLAALALGACGTRGSLVLPPKPTAGAATTPAPETAADDSSTATKAAR
ncbi:lipoprotein [Accumulibacter sp.]|uniref:LPS translocon maturation chaperone LptM n=1 Tax=Accumulibacter sp. TaxID=2053492 RepID=UPI0034454CE4